MSEDAGEAVAQPRRTASLRDGQTCQVFADRIVVGSQEYPFADLTWASLVIDPSVPATPGAPPPPALLLRLRDGREALLSPAELPDAWRLLGAVHTARPDLRAAATPRFGAATPSHHRDTPILTATIRAPRALPMTPCSRGYRTWVSSSVGGSCR